MRPVPGGLHSGNAPSREICVVLAQEVATFLDHLGRSDRIKSYLPVVPRPHEKIESRLTLAEDLASKLVGENDPETQSKLLSALYLILPDIPDDQPDWLSAFERVSISPKKRDVAILLEAINQCVPGQLKRVSKDIGIASPWSSDRTDRMPSRSLPSISERSSAGCRISGGPMLRMRTAA